MGATSTIRNRKDFVIVGPRFARGNRVLEAVHSLYYLPENFKLVFTGSMPAEDDLYKQVMTLIHRDALAERVHFANSVGFSNAKIVPQRSRITCKQDICGDSPEALASAILDIARATV